LLNLRQKMDTFHVPHPLCHAVLWTVHGCSSPLYISSTHMQVGRISSIQIAQRWISWTNAETHSQRFREGILCHIHVPNEPASNHAMTFLFPKTTKAPITKRPRLLPHRARSALARVRLLGLGLSDALGQDLSILILVPCQHRTLAPLRQSNTYRLILHLLGLAALERNAVTLVLQTLGCN